MFTTRPRHAHTAGRHHAPHTHNELGRRLRTWTLIAGVVAGSAYTTATATSSAWENTAHVAPIVDRSDIQEDDPRWVCWVDGNAVCSSVPLDGAGLS